MRRPMRVVALVSILVVAACNQSPGPLHKTDRVAKAEASMAAC